MKIGSFVIALLVLGFSLNGVFAQEVATDAASSVSVESTSAEAPVNEVAPEDESNDGAVEGPSVETPAAPVEPAKEIVVIETPEEPNFPVAEEGTPTVVATNDNITMILVDPVDNVDPIPPIVNPGNGSVSVGPSLGSNKIDANDKCSIPIDGTPAGDCKDDPIPPITPGIPPIFCAFEATGPFTPADCDVSGDDSADVLPSEPGDKGVTCTIEQVDDQTFITTCTSDDGDDGTDGTDGETTPTNASGSTSTTDEETTGGGSMFFSSWNQPSTFSTTPAPTPAPAPAPAAEGTGNGTTGGTVEAAPTNDGSTPALAAETTNNPTIANTGLISGANAPLIGLLALLVIGGVLYVRSRKV